MRIKTNRLLAGLLSIMMVLSMLSVAGWTVFAEDGSNQVRVIVENTTYTDATAPWTGTLVDEWVELDNSSTMMNCVVKALSANGYSQRGAESNYIDNINGLGAFDGGSMSGWMGTLNDWFTNQGFGAFTVANGTLSAGDEIRIMYTVSYGSDLGGSWGNTDKTLKALSFSDGTLTPEFGGSVHSYTLTVPSDVNAVVVTPTASNKNYQVRTDVNGTEYKRTEAVPVEDGTVITVKCGDPAWPSMNSNGGAAQVYTVTVCREASSVSSMETKTENASFYTPVESDGFNYHILLDRDASEATFLFKSDATGAYFADSEFKTKGGKLSRRDDGYFAVPVYADDFAGACEKKYYILAENERAPSSEITLTAYRRRDFGQIYKSVGDYIASLGTPDVGSVGGEWMVIGLARSGRKVSAEYYNNVAGYVKENINDKEQLHRVKSTDNSRVILALTALGYDVTNVDGHDLLAGLTDMSYIKKQGINGPIWALIALDCHGYEIPSGDVTREALTDEVLKVQLSDGGWALSGEEADPDMTAMAIQALAPYYKTDAKVKSAVDNAMNRLSDMQSADGGYLSWGTLNSESCAQIIVALTALGIDPLTDARFIKNGFSVLDALMAFYTDGGFRHTMDGKLNGMATEQGYYALASYARLKENKTSLYDMSDVTVRAGGTSELPNDPDTDSEDNRQDGGVASDDSHSEHGTTVSDDNKQGGSSSQPSGGKDAQRPQTGDSTNMVAYFYLMMLSLAGLGVMQYQNERKYMNK